MSKKIAVYNHTRSADRPKNLLSTHFTLTLKITALTSAILHPPNKKLSSHFPTSFSNNILLIVLLYIVIDDVYSAVSTRFVHINFKLATK